MVGYGGCDPVGNEWENGVGNHHFSCSDEVQPAVDNKNTLFGYFFWI